MKYLTLIITLIFCACCQLPVQNRVNQIKIYDDIRSCVSMRVENLPDSTFNLYKSYQQIELILLKENLLEEVSKKSYKKLLNTFESNIKNQDNNINYDFLFNIIQEKVDHAFWLNAPSIFTATMQCNQEIFEKDSLQLSKFSTYYKTLKEFNNKGVLTDWDLNYRLLDNIPEEEFSNIIVRSPLIAILNAFIEFEREKK